MCKRLVFLISFVLVLGLAGYASATDANEFPASAAPTIDGIKEDAWLASDEQKCPYTNWVNGESEPESDADLSASWWALWDLDNLYVFVDVNDSVLVNDSGEGWQDDSVEVFIDIGNDKNGEDPGFGEDDYQYCIPWYVNLKDKEITDLHAPRSLSGVEFAVATKDANDGYTLEMKFPWDTLDFYGNGVGLYTEVGFEIQINDDDDGGVRDSKVGCFTDQDPWANPSYFGTVVLAPGLKACLPNPANDADGVVSGLLSWTPGKFADKHDVYFGTEPPGELVSDNQELNNYTVSLEPNTIYYWRIDESNDAGPDPCFWEGDVWSFTSAPLTAHHPDPYDGEKWVDVDKDLTWIRGLKAQSHNVYFGTDPENLELKEDESYTTTYDPCTMDDDKTYYWRIDEVNTNDSNLWPGDVWSFTTLDDAAGIKADYYNGTPYLSGKPGLRRTDYSIDFDWSYGRPDPNIGLVALGDQWSVRWVAEVNVPDTNTYTFTFLRNIGDGVRLYIDGQLVIKNWPGDDDILEDTGTIDLTAGLVPIMIEFYDEWGPATARLSWESSSLPKEAIPRDAFFLPRRPVSPDPPSGATDVRSDPNLSWEAGMFADTRDVYFGTDEDRVTDANRDNTLDVLVDFNKPRDVNYYDPGLLEFNKTYYWRVVDVNADTPGGPWPSSVWSFTAGSYHVVDDMEKYNSPITDAWQTSASGSITTSTSPEMAGTVHEGDGYEAMAYSYNNSAGPFYSQAYAEANSPHIGNIVGKDWGLHDVKALSLWFRGQGNPDIRGTHTYSGGQYTITSDSRGMPSNGEAESFYFIYGLTTNATASIYAKVLNVEKTDPYAKAGVMIRESVNQDARFGAVVVTPENGVVFQYRSAAGGAANYASKTGIKPPCWVKVEYVKQGPTTFVKGYYATTEGVPTSWTLITQPQVTLSALNLGLCTTSTHYGRVGTSRISNVTTLPVTALTSSKDIGSVYNAPAPMYVVLEDSNCDDGIVYYPDANNPVEAYASATQIGTWTEWRIDLNDFNDQGVDLADVNKIYIGFGNKSSPTGSGIMYIDDIRLYLAEFYEPECPWDEDLVRDGVIDYNDLGQALRNWLMKDRNVTPVPPTAIPVSRYQLDGNADDTGNPGGHDGEPCGVGVAYNYTNWKDTPASLELTGDGSWIKTDANAADYGIDGNKSRTITAWAYARPSNFEETYEGAIYEIGEYLDGKIFALRTQGEPNLWIAQHWGEGYDISFTYPSMNRWVHFAHVYDHDANTARVYADGYLVGELEVGLDTSATGFDVKNFGIGLWIDGYFDGFIDDVRIYNEVLDQNEIASLAGKTVMFTQPLHMLKTPDADSDLYDDGTMDFKDIAELGKEWGKKKVWPLW